MSKIMDAYSRVGSWKWRLLLYLSELTAEMSCSVIEVVSKILETKAAKQKRHSEETKEKMRQAHLNLKHTIGETRPPMQDMP